MYRDVFKRLLDFLLVLSVLLLGLPVFLLIIVWLHFANKKAGVFFTQERSGMNGKTFKLIKFKSMTDELDENGKLLPDKMRLTKIGAFIRKTSIDETPQLINVLKGEMALIGPRPLLPEYMSFYTERESMRHTVRPGITGWAQVNGRNHVQWDERLENDVYYVEHLSFILDCKIFFRTILNVLIRKDIEVVPTGCLLSEERKVAKNKD